MCCRGDRCFRINCHCMCQRCKACSDCERIWGAGGLVDAIAGDMLSRLTDGIRKKKRFRPAPPPPLPIPPDPDIAVLHKPGLRDQGRSMVHSVGEGCNMQ